MKKKRKKKRSIVFESFDLKVIYSKYRKFSIEWEADKIFLNSTDLNNEWIALDGDYIAEEEICVTKCEHGIKSADIMSLIQENERKYIDVIAEMGSHSDSDLETKMSNSSIDLEYVVTKSEINASHDYLFLHVVKGRNRDMTSITRTHKFLKINGHSTKVYFAYEGLPLSKYLIFADPV